MLADRAESGTVKPAPTLPDERDAQRDRIERANLRHMINNPDALPIFRDDCGLLPRHFRMEEYRGAYKAILHAAATGTAVPEDVLALLAARDGER
jgi:hypothetical protein